MGLDLTCHAHHFILNFCYFVWYPIWPKLLWNADSKSYAAVRRCHFQWPRVTLNPDFNVTWQHISVGRTARSAVPETSCCDCFVCVYETAAASVRTFRAWSTRWGTWVIDARSATRRSGFTSVSSFSEQSVRLPCSLSNMSKPHLFDFVQDCSTACSVTCYLRRQGAGYVIVLCLSMCVILCAELLEK